ncbi:MAG: HAMP domain-containing sensor histidine kinase [Chitinophagaceae bacterium]
MKIQTKTTILFTSLTAAVFLVLTATVYYFSNQFAYTDFYKRLELRARISAKFIFEQDHISTEAFKQLQKQYLERLPDEESYTIKIAPNGDPLPPRPARLPLSYLKKIQSGNGTTVYYRDNSVHYAGLLYKDETGQFLVIESALNSYGNEIIKRLRNILIVTLVASIVLIYTVGLYFSRKTFQPFRYITNKVQTISESNLHLRLTEQAGADEIAELINTFNKMLDRLETAFETQNNFISNASHELRTPLTAIVAEADYVLSQERSAEVYRKSLDSIVQQAAKLQHLTKGLLSLAQTTFDGKKQQWGKVRVDELLYEVKENAGGIFSNKVLIHLPSLPENDEDICITGNYDLLKIALGNIVLNACKYSADEIVSVRLTIQEKQAIISVADKGIGIPAIELKHIYDPFFRASNTKNFEGYGIGMPLSGNIIRMHRGKIEVNSTVKQGTTVTIILPLG